MYILYRGSVVAYEPSTDDYNHTLLSTSSALFRKLEIQRRQWQPS